MCPMREIKVEEEHLKLAISPDTANHKPKILQELSACGKK